MSFNTGDINPNAFYEAQWCPEIGNREKRQNIDVEINGKIGKGIQQPIQNLRVSLNGTEITTTCNNDYDIGQELYFLRRWWRIVNVDIGLSEYAPQSAAIVGDELNNAVFIIEIVSVGKKI